MVGLHDIPWVEEKNPIEVGEEALRLGWKKLLIVLECSGASIIYLGRILFRLQ